MARPAWSRWAWFWGLWAGGVVALGLAAGLLKLLFGAILR
jgi:hypothetical protein